MKNKLLGWIIGNVDEALLWGEKNYFFTEFACAATFKIPHVYRIQFDIHRTPPRLDTQEKLMHNDGRENGNSTANAEPHEDESRDYLWK